MIVKRWLVYTPEDKIVDWAGFGALTDSSPEYEQNKHLCQMNMNVLSDYQRKGIGTALLKTMVKEAQALNRTHVMKLG